MYNRMNYVVFFFNDTATTEIYTSDTLFLYTTLFRSPSTGCRRDKSGWGFRSVGWLARARAISTVHASICRRYPTACPPSPLCIAGENLPEVALARARYRPRPEAAGRVVISSCGESLYYVRSRKTPEPPWIAP